MTENVTRVKSTDTTARIAVLEHQMEMMNRNIANLETKVEGQYEVLHSRISDMRDQVHDEISRKHDAVMNKLTEQDKASTEQHKALADKVTSFERWRWMIMGGAMVAGYVMAHMRLEKLF